MICILGASAAGKSTIERELEKRGYKRIISYTSRAKRANETDDIDYHYISAEEFLKRKQNGFFAEFTVYNSWNYGIAKQDCDRDATAVVEPVGFRRLKKLMGSCVTSFFITVPENVRMIRMMQRGDNLMEAIRRIISDQGSFNGIQDEVDYVVNNDRPLEETVKEILKILDMEKINANQ